MIYFAHRGDNRNFTENTIAAFRSSLRKNFRAMELDLITLKDQEVVIFHDDTLFRLAGDVSVAKNLNLEEFKSKFPDLATLHELEDLFSKAAVTVNFEIKDEAATLQKSIEIIRRFHDPVVSSFYTDIVENSIDAGLPSAYLFHKESDLLRGLNKLRSKRLHLNKEIILEGGAIIDILRDYEVYCYTVNDPEEVKLLQQYPFIKGIFTDKLIPE
jgi:glycerophosphoryl diester phosphodiesterase